MLNSKTENSPEEDPQHSLHICEKAPGTKFVAAVAQWWGQQNPSLCPSGSTVVAEPHQADLMLLSPEVAAIVTVTVIGDVLTHTTVTGGVVLVVVT